MPGRTRHWLPATVPIMPNSQSTEISLSNHISIPHVYKKLQCRMHNRALGNILLIYQQQVSDFMWLCPPKH